MADTILQRVAAGEPGAMDACLTQYQRLVWSLARQFLPNHADAEDAVQEVFFELWRNAARFDPALGSETTYIATLTRRRLIDRLRRTGRKAKPASLCDRLDTAARPEPDRLETAEEAAKAKERLRRLRPQERQVIELLVEGMSHSEIASETRLPIGTVKTHARRGLARLRRMLGVPADSGAPVESGARPASKSKKENHPPTPTTS